jgi:hypothetical protein
VFTGEVPRPLLSALRRYGLEEAQSL